MGLSFAALTVFCSACLLARWLPQVWLRPEQHRVQPQGVYQCPVYKTLTRQGELSTTGHSTNFILYTELPCGSRSSSFWVLRGVALFTSLA
jgi:dynein heavy chain